MAEIRGVSHIGVAVNDIEQQKGFYRDVLGLELVGEEEVADQGVKVAMFRAGEVMIELLEPMRPDSPIGRFLERRGEGLHHLSYQVDAIEPMLARLKTAGLRLVDESPRPGAHGQRIAFLHPASTFGVLTELCEGDEGERDAAPRDRDEI